MPKLECPPPKKSPSPQEAVFPRALFRASNEAIQKQPDDQFVRRLHPVPEVDTSRIKSFNWSKWVVYHHTRNEGYFEVSRNCTPYYSRKRNLAQKQTRKKLRRWEQKGTWSALVTIGQTSRRYFSRYFGKSVAKLLSSSRPDCAIVVCLSHAWRKNGRRTGGGLSSFG